MNRLMTTEALPPAVKWSGSKRHVAGMIVSRFPKRIGTYWEPFCGGASVLMRLLRSNVEVERFVCSDLNGDLIALWNAIKNRPNELCDHYECEWTRLNADDDIGRKKSFYMSIRDRFNGTGIDSHRPEDFLFLMRTCTNGMPRYNSSRKFNTAFHITRKGIEPKTLRDIVNEWSRILNDRCVTFEKRSYSEITPDDGDFMFLDPSYAATRGMYFGGFDVGSFFGWLEGVRCGYALTFDGVAGVKDMTYPVPERLYDVHEYIVSGNSSFRRLIETSSDTVVRESLYVRNAALREV